jgi:three-Cys-motif partner protein
MPKSKWIAPPHTIAKHQIYAGYLTKWHLIFSRAKYRSWDRLRICDAFAGVGEYDDGRPGSPIIAMQTNAENRRSNPSACPVEFLFVEDEQEYYIRLKQNVESEQQKRPSAIWSCEVRYGDAETESRQFLAANKGTVTPTLFFLDQYGYSKAPMKLIRDVMQHEKHEALVYVNWKRMKPYFTDETKADAYTRAFGCDAWRKLIGKRSGAAAEAERLYKQCLRERAGVSYVLDFPMRDKNGQVIYWLFFCTNSTKGLAEMKKAMWEVDSGDGSGFRDGDENQPLFPNLETFGEDELASELLARFQDEWVTMAKVEEFVLTETPAYKYAEALGRMWKRKMVETKEAGKGRPKFTDPNLGVRFKPEPPPPLKQPELFPLS